MPLFSLPLPLSLARLVPDWYIWFQTAIYCCAPIGRNWGGIKCRLHKPTWKAHNTPESQRTYHDPWIQAYIPPLDFRNTDLDTQIHEHIPQQVNTRIPKMTNKYKHIKSSSRVTLSLTSESIHLASQPRVLYKHTTQYNTTSQLTYVQNLCLGCRALCIAAFLASIFSAMRGGAEGGLLLLCFLHRTSSPGRPWAAGFSQRIPWLQG